LDETKLDAVATASMHPHPGNPNVPTSCPAMTVAMLYVPVQVWETPYDAETGLARGTIFPSLDKPFVGEGSWAR